MITEGQLMQRAQQLEREYATEIADIRAVQRRNFMRVLDAFHAVRLSTSDLRPMSGYGIGDNLRDKTERIFAHLYGAQAALVRPQIISGTHALAIALFGTLRPGDLLCCVTGAPYDTMEEIIGIRPSDGSLAEFGISYAQCDITASPQEVWEEQLERCFSTQLPKLVLIQRSRG
ncbi:MAG: methionine gamma-lyase family protein, partial [Caldiserica bacterium]|nr:methionine gamma-lyase family protein [Caldisericota bacterium]